ncbi:hypothetical protein LRP30_21390 [Bradyrhizobium sp. C-145]|uniref:hypothetical protein n=1 Tax=Bradyrhizobium sp. C-145 TaxID=574727 RepID=UPI00201B97CD|nr:hypothetical protein [Bradyrhizobium sp. C-145]UQR67644.1 hypothetical protein LRP30_21390 [Bradyrhizobium sp. C-145]
MKALRVIGYVCLSLVSVYSVVFSDSKNFQWLVVACWAAVFYYWWIEDRDARKIREEKRFQELASRVAYLERQTRTLEYQVGELQRVSSRGGTWSPPS